MPSCQSNFKAIGVFSKLHTVAELRKMHRKFISRKTDHSRCNMGCPFHLWVAFGDRTTVFGQHCYCICHNSTAVMSHAKFCNDHLMRIKVRAKQNFHWIWIAMEKLSEMGPKARINCNAGSIRVASIGLIPAQFWHVCMSRYRNMSLLYSQAVSWHICIPPKTVYWYRPHE